LRTFINFPEAQNEIMRDLAELGTLVRTETMQHFDVTGKEEFDTMELMNYGYTVTRPNYQEVQGVHEAWVEQEWRDRLAGDLNPGFSWKERPEIWEPMLERSQYKQNMGKVGKFSYSYSQRMGGNHLRKLIEEIKVRPNSRQLYLPVWYPNDEDKRVEKRRVPCSLGYHFMLRGGQLHITYMMRSCDFVTHYGNDVALATMLLEYIARMTKKKMGSFNHFVGSLHAYRKDLEGVF